jgi:pilus assembly protein Flp/PilA
LPCYLHRVYCSAINKGNVAPTGTGEATSKTDTFLLTERQIMTNAITRFMRDEEGATAIEYGVIAGMITILLIAIMAPTGTFGTALTGLFSRVAAQLGLAVP